MAYRPSQRSVPANVLTRAGWLTGTFHVPERGRFVDSLNRPSEFIRITDVAMKGRFDHLPFIALQRSAVILIVPPETESNLSWRPEVEPLVPHEVACLLDLGLVTGIVEVLKNVRVSDFFAHRDDFVLLRESKIRVGAPGAASLPEQRQAHCIINAACVIGVSDTNPPEDELRGEAGPSTGAAG